MRTCKNIVELSFWYISRLMNDFQLKSLKVRLGTSPFLEKLYFSPREEGMQTTRSTNAECCPIPETGNSVKFSQKKLQFTAKDIDCSGSSIFIRRLQSFYSYILKISIYYLLLIYFAYLLFAVNI